MRIQFGRSNAPVREAWSNRHARFKVGATVVHGAKPDVKRRVRNSSNTATRIGRGPPAGVTRRSASFGAAHSSLYGHQSSLLDRVPDQKIRLQCNSQPGFERRAERFGVGGAERALYRYGFFRAFRIGEAPGLAAREIGVAQARVFPQIPRSKGRAVPREVVRRTDHPAPHRTQPTRNQAGIGQIRDAHCDIDTAGNQIHHPHPVIELKLYNDLGIGSQKVWQCRCHMAQAKRHRRGQAHPAVWNCRRSVGFGQFQSNASIATTMRRSS